MNDLERARAHLRRCQEWLAYIRKSSWGFNCRPDEESVLAALEWVWTEQEKARAENRAEFSRWLDGIIAERFAEPPT